MSCKAAYDTRYVYGADALGAEGTLDNNFRLRKRRACATYGNRAAKWTATKSSETLYFNTMWTWHTDKGLPEGQYSKHIYLGETRVVTKQTSKLEASYGQSDEWHHQYYYHPDHLGSAQLVTDYEGNEYQRIEYTPYGELWVEKKSANEKDMRYLPYKFTAKEMDEETGLYYYGARYLDAKYSRWLSTDPAVGEYVSGSSAGGGIYNTVNFSLYHYAGDNPIKYTDPTGMSLDDWQDNGDGTWTVKSEGAKLWDVWGANWQEESGFARDPRTLQVGETVGKKNSQFDSNQATRNEIAAKAASYEGSTEWAIDVAKDNFKAGSYKCNQFVYDVTTESNASPGTPNGNILKKITRTTDNPPTAGQWGNPNYNIPGWKVLAVGEIPLPGDVGAEAHNYSDATGHCGIVVGKNLTASSNAGLNSTITINDWGFREGQENSVVFRRWVGNK